MSFAAPVWLAVAGLVAAGVIVAHLIATSQPRRDVLPTVRFIPQSAPLTVTRTRRPRDLLLLLARLVAVALFGLALAGAHVTRRAPGRVVVIDYSAPAADSRDMRRSAAREGDSVVIVFGDTAGPATLSGALVAAHRAIAGLDHSERSELVIVSPLVRDQVDSATAPLIALWPGPVRVDRTRARTPFDVNGVTVVARGDDPVAAAAATIRGGPVRVFRSALPTVADSAWARDSGGVLVVWPAYLAGLARREPADTQHGIAAGRHVVVGTFARTHVPGGGRVLVRWLDGAPAATERAVGTGCVREVAIPVDAAGDLALRESFRGITQALTSPCGGPRDLAPVDLASLLPRDRRPRAAQAGVAGAGRLAVWLALAALTVLFAEQLLRRRQT